MVRGIWIDKEKKVYTFEGIKEIGKIKENSYMLWIDMEDPADEEITILSDEFKFHELAIEDCIFPQSQPKIEDFGDYLFLVIHGLLNHANELKQYEINIFVTKNHVITIHDEKLPYINTLFKKCEQNPQLLIKGSEYILHAVVDLLVDNYFPILEVVEDKIDVVEDEIVKEPTDTSMSKIFSIKKDILFMRKSLEPQIIVINSLATKNFLFFRKEIKPYFRDIQDHIKRVVSMCDTYRELIISLMDIYLASVSAQQNKILKTATVIATIFLPPLLIASYYGMNVKFPEQLLEWGALPLIWVIMGGLTAFVYLFFKKRKWI